MTPGLLHTNGNSGAGAINLAALWGASRIVLLGFDYQATGGKIHWHGDHEGDLPNRGKYAQWCERMVAVARDLRHLGVHVLNATRATAITSFERCSLADALHVSARPQLHIRGMHGLGDNLHQRAIVRQLMERADVWLETPWPSVYHDMVGNHLRLIDRGSSLRTQAKNARREAALFTDTAPPDGASELRVSYAPSLVRRTGSVLGAMAETCNVRVAEFALPIPAEWTARASALVTEWKRSGAWDPAKPLMIVRPLSDRTEWGGCKARNPDQAAFASLHAAIADRFFVVSIADLEPGREWIVDGVQPKADLELHGGELDFQTLAALTAQAGLVYSSPGFAIVLAQAVGTPAICIFGGYENSSSFSAGGRFSPYLGVDPIVPCADFAHNSAHPKAIDTASALARIEEFLRCPTTFPA